MHSLGGGGWLRRGAVVTPGGGGRAGRSRWAVSYLEALIAERIGSSVFRQSSRASVISPIIAAHIIRSIQLGCTDALSVRLRASCQRRRPVGDFDLESALCGEGGGGHVGAVVTLGRW